MKLNDYQMAGWRTMPELAEPGTTEEKLNLSNYAMGLAGEAGEVVDILKKIVHHGHEMDREEIKLELGDALHYLSGVATMCSLTLDEIAEANVEKLKKRYPNGFNGADSVNRSE